MVSTARARLHFTQGRFFTGHGFDSRPLHMRYKLSKLFCISCCPHGEMCGLEPGHAGLHGKTSRCRWTDSEAITKAQADRAVMRTGARGVAIILLERITRLLHGITND